MKTITTILFSVFISTAALAQKADSLQKKQQEHLKKELAITDAKAKQVTGIMDDYKSKAKALSANTTLKEEEKRAQFDALIAEKNNKLEKVLDEKQLDKLLPTSERKNKTKKN